MFLDIIYCCILVSLEYKITFISFSDNKMPTISAPAGGETAPLSDSQNSPSTGKCAVNKQMYDYIGWQSSQTGSVQCTTWPHAKTSLHKYISKVIMPNMNLFP